MEMRVSAVSTALLARPLCGKRLGVLEQIPARMRMEAWFLMLSQLMVVFIG